MCQRNKSSFEVDYNILASECQVRACFLPESPTIVLEIFDKAAKYVPKGRENWRAHYCINSLQFMETTALSELFPYHFLAGCERTNRKSTRFKVTSTFCCVVILEQKVPVPQIH
jgi:hypothetical protein